MSMIDDKKITSRLFRQDVRSTELKNEFSNVFDTTIDDVLYDYEYDELDEFPVEIDNKGIMIGFSAETKKASAQIEYIDVNISRHPRNLDYLVKKMPVISGLQKSHDIEEQLSPVDRLRIYYALSDVKHPDRVIFQYDDLRYELSLNANSAVSRIRVCLAEDESSINMRTYYLFDTL